MISQEIVNNIKIIVLDFDGVLTNNYVYLNADGDEFVRCSRSDGLAFDALNKLKRKTVILSTEKNAVVKARASKLNVPSVQGVSDKYTVLLRYLDDMNLLLSEVLYVRNDINDIKIMKHCAISACPSDSVNEIKDISDIVLERAGGDGVIRELTEKVLGLNVFNILYGE